jgi:hypothetical protein
VPRHRSGRGRHSEGGISECVETKAAAATLETMKVELRRVYRQDLRMVAVKVQAIAGDVSSL